MSTPPTFWFCPHFLHSYISECKSPFPSVLHYGFLNPSWDESFVPELRPLLFSGSSGLVRIRSQKSGHLTSSRKDGNLHCSTGNGDVCHPLRDEMYDLFTDPGRKCGRCARRTSVEMPRHHVRYSAPTLPLILRWGGPSGVGRHRQTTGHRQHRVRGVRRDVEPGTGEPV